jgi:hypothetical protein
MMGSKTDPVLKKNHNTDIFFYKKARGYRGTKNQTKRFINSIINVDHQWVNIIGFHLVIITGTFNVKKDYNLTGASRSMELNQSSDELFLKLYPGV